MPAILKYGYGQYYRRYNTKSVLYVKRANLTPLQKKYYAKMYRLGLIEKKCYQYRSADMAKEIKRMQFLQEQYLFICKNDISSVTDLIRLHDEAKQTLAKVDSRQKEIYKERYVRKRKCKTVEDFKEYQIWNLESTNELDNLKGSIIFLMGLASNVLGYRHPAAILDRSKNKCCGLITDGEELKNNQLCFSVDTTVLHLFSDLSRTCPRTSGGWIPPLALTPKNNRSVSFLVA